MQQKQDADNRRQRPAGSRPRDNQANDTPNLATQQTHNGDSTDG